VEIAANVADDPRSVITQQVANGVAVRMAVLYRLLAGDNRRPPELLGELEGARA
jgi:aspartate carbamoyltransferase catalytic subunit